MWSSFIKKTRKKNFITRGGCVLKGHPSGVTWLIVCLVVCYRICYSVHLGSTHFYISISVLYNNHLKHWGLKPFPCHFSTWAHRKWNTKCWWQREKKNIFEVLWEQDETNTCINGVVLLLKTEALYQQRPMSTKCIQQVHKEPSLLYNCCQQVWYAFCCFVEIQSIPGEMYPCLFDRGP